MSATTDSELTRALLARYCGGQAADASGEVYRNVRSAWPHYVANYAAIVSPLTRSARILEVGCGHGSMVAWLLSLGFERVEAVDASPGDVAFAQGHLGRQVVTLGDGREYLEQHPAAYDLIIMKAVLEHVPKVDLLAMVHAVGRGLAPGGRAVFEVPNMAWLLSGHERYLDLTHEVGFTRPSLTSLLSVAFGSVSITGSRLADPTRSQRWLRRALLRAIRRALYILGEGASDVDFAHRSLIAVAQDPVGPFSGPDGAAGLPSPEGT